MAASDVKTVWILGSGFSYSLGGPLLADLFRMRAWGDDQLDYPRSTFPRLASDLFETRVIFNSGHKEGMWRNAEDFLAYLDDAFEPKGGSPRQKALLSLMGRTERQGHGKTRPQPADPEPTESISAFRDSGNTVVRRALAAECNTFLEGLDKSDERWEPYKNWIRTLDPNKDTIITFNYDRVLALADEYANGSTPRLKTLLPHDCGPVPVDKVPVLKLHGSVDWILEGEGDTCIQTDSHSALMNIKNRIAIAAPGRSKTKSVEGYLQPLWTLAKERLRFAGHVAILGYSMPATDARARLALQEAIREDGAGYQHRRVDIVMGPDTSRSEVRRLMALMESCRKSRSLVVSPRELPAKCRSNVRFFYVVAQPLGAEDFIADYVQRLVDWEPLPDVGATATSFP